MSMQNIPLLTLTAKLSGTVASNRFITPLGAQAGADVNTIGVTRSAGVAGNYVPVEVIGTSVVESGAAFAIGATLKSDSLGRAITWVTSGARVAVALEAATAAGQMIEVNLISNAA